MSISNTLIKALMLCSVEFARFDKTTYIYFQCFTFSVLGVIVYCAMMGNSVTESLGTRSWFTVAVSAVDSAGTEMDRFR